MYVNVSPLPMAGPMADSGFADHWNDAYQQDTRMGMWGDRGELSASSVLSTGSHDSHRSHTSLGSNSSSSHGRHCSSLEAHWAMIVAKKETQFGGELPWSRDPGSGVPMVLWCEGSASGRVEHIKSLADRFYRSEFRHFTSPVNFTRWLFEQGVSTAEPWAVLVVGWREAKPCTLAIRAAVTGNTSGLRYDAKCPPLKFPAGPLPEGARLTTAVKAIIVIPDSETQADRAEEWAHTEARNCRAGLHVAYNLSSLIDLMDQLLLPSSRGAPPADFPLAMYLQPGTTRISL